MVVLREQLEGMSTSEELHRCKAKIINCVHQNLLRSKEDEHGDLQETHILFKLPDIHQVNVTEKDAQIPYEW